MTLQKSHQSQSINNHFMLLKMYEFLNFANYFLFIRNEQRNVNNRDILLKLFLVLEQFLSFLALRRISSYLIIIFFFKHYFGVVCENLYCSLYTNKIFDNLPHLKKQLAGLITPPSINSPCFLSFEDNSFFFIQKRIVVKNIATFV